MSSSFAEHLDNRTLTFLALQKVLRIEMDVTFLTAGGLFGLFLRVLEVALVDKALDADAQLGFVVVRNNPVGDGDNLDLVEMEFVYQSQHLAFAS